MLLISLVYIGFNTPSNWASPSILDKPNPCPWPSPSPIPSPELIANPCPVIPKSCSELMAIPCPELIPKSWVWLMFIVWPTSWDRP